MTKGVMGGICGPWTVTWRCNDMNTRGFLKSISQGLREKWENILELVAVVAKENCIVLLEIFGLGVLLTWLEIMCFCIKII